MTINQLWGRAIGTATTTDATVTSLLVLTLPTTTVAVVRVVVTAKTGALSGAGWAMEGTFKNTAGTVAQIGATLTTLSVQDAALLTAAVVFDVTGATARVRVTGIVATTIEWQATAEYPTN